MLRYLPCVVVFVLMANRATAQNDSGGPVVDWLVNHEVSIRKTFEGKSKEESEPAKISYNNPDAGRDFWLVDLGVKFGEWDLCADCNGSVIVYPTFEWHRSTNEFEANNKVKAGPSMDILLGDLTKKRVIPIILVKATYNRDAVKDTNSGTFTGLAGLMGANKSGGGNTWLPMSHINDAGGNLILRYAPFVGVEHNSNLIIERKGLPSIDANELTALALHLQIDLYPLNSADSPGWFEIVTSYAYRRRLNGDEQIGDHLNAFSVSANLYVDVGRHFAIGYDYESGRKPTNNFDDQHSSSIGLKVKF